MPEWTDKYVEELIGNLLRVGVTVASAVVLLGGVIYLLRHGVAAPDYHHFVGAPAQFRSLSGILKSAFAGRGQGIVQLGLLLLIATPVARVALSVGAFAVQKDRMYVLVTLIVLAILLYSLIFGQ